MNRPEPRQDALAPAQRAIERHRDELKKRFPLPTPVKRAKRAAPATLGLVIAALGLGGLFWLDPAYRTEQYASAVGRVETIQLADGSVVTLGGASRVDVSWHLRSRRVALHKGQALFDVAPTRYRPFLTRAGSTKITVVGTRYSVSRYEGDVRVAVAEGRVSVHSDGGDLLLAPGDQVVVRRGRLEAPTRVDAAAVGAWTEGRLVFDRTPLGEVLDVLERYRGIPVHLDDASLADLSVTGTFDSSRLDGLLALLPKVLPVERVRDTDGALHLRRRDEAK